MRDLNTSFSILNPRSFGLAVRVVSPAPKNRSKFAFNNKQTLFPSLLPLLIYSTILSGCVGSTVNTALETAALNSPDTQEVTFSPESVDPNIQLSQIPIPVRSPNTSQLALAPTDTATLPVAEATSQVIADPTIATKTPLVVTEASVPSPASNVENPPATVDAQSQTQLASAPIQTKPQPAKKPVGFFQRLFSAKKQTHPQTTAKLEPKKQVRRPVAANGNDLPGVNRSSALFGIDEDPHNDTPTLKTPGDVQVASVGGYTRHIRNGLILQTANVQVDCLKPELMKILKTVDHHFKKRVMVTSGYRSPRHNRRVGGVNKSTHIYCKAADIQVEGVSKWDLAKYLRTLPNRGGVGTYCRTKSVHIDVGTKRDWHYPCRRRKKKRKA